MTPACHARTTFITVNGIRHHGQGTVDRCRDWCRSAGYQALDPRVPWRFVLSPIWGGKTDGQRIVEAVGGVGGYVIAHSYGCRRALWAHAHMLKEYGRGFDGMFFFGAAVPANHELPNIRIWNFYSPNDGALKIGRYIPWFGAAGLTGFDRDAVNVRRSGNHSHYFAPYELERNMNYIVSEVERVA